MSFSKVITDDDQSKLAVLIVNMEFKKMSQIAKKPSYLEREQWGNVYIANATSKNNPTLQDLVSEKYSVIVQRNALPLDKLKNVTEAIYKLQNKIQKKDYLNGTLTTFGPYLAKYLDTLPEYFSTASQSDELFLEGEDLRKVVRDQICQTFKCNSLVVAKEKDGKQYAPATFRIHANGVSNPLHNDNIMRDAKHTDLILKDLKYQFSCVVCIQECDLGGELKHYKKRWKPEDEIYKIQNGIGYNTEVIQNTLYCKFKPETADIYLMDPTHYHEILEVKGKDRITMGFFIGFYDNDVKDGIIWS